MEIIEQLEDDSSIDEFNSVLQLIERAVYVKDTNTLTPIPLKTTYHFNGVTCPIYTDKSMANEICEQMSVAYNLELEIQNISAFWDFVKFSAKNGSDGLVLNNKYPIFYFNRISDIDKSTPTIIGIKLLGSELTNNLVLFGRNGYFKSKPGMIIEWSDIERMDKLSVEFALNGDMLPDYPLNPFMIQQNGVQDLIFQNGATILGKYVSDIGAIPIFSNYEHAHNFAIWHGIDVESNEYNLVEVNLLEKLEDIYSRHLVFCDIGLNPEFNRYEQGWFFKSKENWYLETISGTWRIESNNFIKEEATSYKSIFTDSYNNLESWKNLRTQARFPIKRITGANTVSFEEDDAEEFLHSFEDQQFEPIEISEGNIPSRENYMVDMFDAITGENQALSNYIDCNDLGFLVFEDIFSFVSYIKKTLLPVDEEVRVQGATLCHGGGISGSNNKEKEELITKSITICMDKLLKEVLRSGYKPYHSLILKDLLNKNTAVIQIKSLGYFADIIFYDLYDEADFSLKVEECDIDEKAKKKFQSLHTRIIQEQELPEDVKLKMVNYLGSSFSSLSTDSQLILSTALNEFENAGKSNYFDYAGISMKIAKVFERELNINVFKKWSKLAKSSFSKEEIKEMLIDRNIYDSEALLYKVLNKNEKPTIGNTLFLFRSMSGSSKPLTRHFNNFLVSKMQWLLSEDFMNLMNDILKKYRNGGVHEHMVTYETCNEAIVKTITGKSPYFEKFIKSCIE